MCDDNSRCGCDGVWRVKVTRNGRSIHVRPQKGGWSDYSWADGMFQHRWEYPKTENQLLKAMQKCQERCDELNAGERKAARMKMIADRIMDDLNDQV